MPEDPTLAEQPATDKATEAAQEAWAEAMETARVSALEKLQVAVDNEAETTLTPAEAESLVISYRWLTSCVTLAEQTLKQSEAKFAESLRKMILIKSGS